MKKVNGYHPPRSDIYVRALTAALRGHPLSFDAPEPHRLVAQPNVLEPAWPAPPAPAPPAPPRGLRVPEPLKREPEAVEPAPKPPTSRRTKKSDAPLIVVRKQPLPPAVDPDDDGGPAAA